MKLLDFNTWPFAGFRRGGKRGVALVITLILLAVITTLAIAFLAITRRETVAVGSMARTTDAEMAGDSALERAKAEILAVYPVRNQTGPAAVPPATNILGPDMLVSVCCHNYVPDPSAPTDPAKAKVFRYNRESPDQRLSFNYDAAPPVFVDTNRPGQPGPRGPLDDRFFVDLNRNGYFEETGFVRDVDVGPFGTNEINWRIGDPQWVGVLRNPRRPLAADNPFIGRQAFMVLPVGRSLDVNWIHNDVKDDVPPGPGGSWYSRNQGVGTYELNLAGFLSDLNTNIWSGGYFYQTLPGSESTGVAFSDAWQILNARYDNSKAGVDRLGDHLPYAPTRFAIEDQGVDLFGNGVFDFTAPRRSNWPWPGSMNRRHITGIHDYFNPSSIPRIPPVNQPGFQERLRDAGTNGNSYDRYTFYRMLAQLGTDSVEEDEGKININYVNIRSWIPGSSVRYRAEQLVSWTNTTVGFVNEMGRSGPELFFLSVVTNLIGREPALAFMVTNQALAGGVMSIPVFTNRSIYTTNAPIPGPLYAGRVHQILQLAANIYDATTGSKQGEGPPFYPTIFRPHFGVAANGDVYITNYTLMAQSAADFLLNPWRDLESGQTITPGTTSELVYGVPLIVAARKGFPSFSEVGVTTVAEAWRKLTFFRTEAGKPISSTNQEFNLRVYQKLQLEARNPYATNLARTYDIVVNHWSTTQATNSSTQFPFTGPPATNRFLRATGWPRESLTSVAGVGEPNYLVLPSMEHTIIKYQTNTVPDRGGSTNHWYVTLTNRLLFYIIDRSPEAGPAGRIVDAVTLKTPTNHMDIARLLHSDLTYLLRDREPPPSGAIRPIWSQEKDDAASSGGVSRGVVAQINVSRYPSLVNDNDWLSYAGTASKPDSGTSFNTFIEDNTIVTNRNAPFTPHRVIAQTDYYQVNDPMVHYTLEDLVRDPDYSFIGSYSRTNPVIGNLTANNLGRRNIYSVAWNKGDFGDMGVPPGQGPLDITLRDPGLVSSDVWNFPTNVFPSVGWLGRVHRGTPWQTIYFKSRIPSGDWLAHAGPSRGTDSTALMRPERDWELLDIFTTAPHPNAARGKLSINQTNHAAWSAVLSGVMARVPEGPDGEGFVTARSELIQPSDISSLPAITNAVRIIAQSIATNRLRFNANGNNPRGEFNSLGQILSVPELSDWSPFLTIDRELFSPGRDASLPADHPFQGPKGNAVIYDEDYERIPQQILSLLKVGEPRFVVYAWGQSLMPARRGVQLDGAGRIDLTKPLDGPSITVDPGGPRNGFVNNYQVTGEVATKAVVRVVFPERIPATGAIDYTKPKLVVESFNLIDVE